MPKSGRRPDIILPGALAALLGPIAWNAILDAAHGNQFFTDLPFIVFPISWQDTGSGVFTLAAAPVLYGLFRGAEPARRVAGYGLLAALAALLVDVYLY